MTTPNTIPRARVADYKSDADYHADRTRLSGSSLDMFISNPALYWAWKNGADVSTTSPSMAFGSLFHSLLLEPGTWRDRFAVRPFKEGTTELLNGNSNAYKAWKAEQVEAGREVITPAQVADVQPMVDAIEAVPYVHDLLTRDGGINEIALHWDLEGTGRPMRAKLDRILPELDIIVELKTCRSADPENGKNQWDWYGYGYHRKAYLYLDAYRQVFGRNATMVHVFVETGSKHPRVFVPETQVDSHAAQCGEIEVLEALGHLQRCEEAKDFRASWEYGAPGHRPMSLPLPGPVLSELEFKQNGPFELTVDGKAVGV